LKKPYQIESQRAVKRLEEMAADGNPAVQMMLPMAEMVGWLRKGVGELIRQAGLQIMQLLMEEEVKSLVGERSRLVPERTANRWGSERGYCVVMGQKVPVERPRVRSTEDREIRLGSYEMFHRGEPLTETVWEKLMLGLSTRKYGRAVREFAVVSVHIRLRRGFIPIGRFREKLNEGRAISFIEPLFARIKKQHIVFGFSKLPCNQCTRYAAANHYNVMFGSHRVDLLSKDGSA